MKKTLSVILLVCMILGMLPATVLAEGNDVQTVTENVEKSVYEIGQYEIDYRQIQNPQGMAENQELEFVKSTSATDEALLAQQTAHNIISTYVDPQYQGFWDYGYGMSEEQIAELKTLAQSLTAGCTSDYDSIWAITEYVADTIYYDNEFYLGYADTTEIWPYDVYTSKKTVCSGYTQLVGTLLNYVDIPCMSIAGENHAYNAAYDSDNKRWIYLDATWCSNNVYTSEQKWVYRGVSDSFFDMSPEFMANLSNHEIYSVLGLVSNQSADFYYSLQTNADEWTDMTQWYLMIYAPKQYGDVKAVSNIDGYVVEQINSYANFSELTSIDLSQTKVSILGDDVFKNCKKLKEVKLPSSLVEIGDRSFYYCSSLSEIDLSQTKVDTLGEYSFAGCANLAKVKFPECLSQIGKGSFFCCGSLEQIDLSQTKVSIIDEMAFMNCTQLATVKFSNALTEIAKLGFYNCPLSQIDLENTKVNTIGEEAFAEAWTRIITLPSTIKTIGTKAFFFNTGGGWYANQDTLVVTELTAQQIGYSGPNVEDSPWQGREVTIAPGKYTIQFNGNGADNDNTTTMICGLNVSYKLNTNSFYKSNYIFAGWNTKADGSGVAYADGATVNNLTKDKNGIVNLYAQWVKDSYVGDVNTELQTFSYDSNTNYLSGQIVVVEWRDTNGDGVKESTVPSCAPTMEFVSTDGTESIEVFVTPTGTNTYYFDRLLGGLTSGKEYKFQVTSGDSRNVSEYRSVPVYTGTSGIGTEGKLGLVNGQAVSFKTASDGTLLLYGKDANATYEGHVNSLLTTVECTQSGLGNFVSGNIIITEWIDGVSTVPETTPTMSFESYDGTEKNDVFMLCLDGTNTFYFDRNLSEDMDVNKEYIFRVTLTEPGNVSTMKSMVVTTNEMASKEGVLWETATQIVKYKTVAADGDNQLRVYAVNK